MKSIILVEPEIPENTGFIARLCANFDYELKIVNPDFNLEEARKTASKAQEKLREARIYDELEEAIKEVEYVVATKPGRGQKAMEFKARENTSIMIGRESRGLSNKEIDLCDAVVHIEASEYSSLNQSHAAGILMHEFSTNSEPKGATDFEVVEKFIEIPILRKIIKQANPTQDELNNLIGQMRDKDYF